MTKLNFKILAILWGIVSVAFSTNAIEGSSQLSSIPLELPFVSSKQPETMELAQAKPLGDETDDLSRRRFWQKLNLTSEQQQQMQVVKQKYKPEMSNLRGQIQAEREKLATMMQGNQSDSSLRAQHQKIVNLDQQIHNLRFESMLEMRSVLNTQQRQEFAEIMGNRRANRRRGNP